MNCFPQLSIRTSQIQCKMENQNTLTTFGRQDGVDEDYHNDQYHQSLLFLPWKIYMARNNIPLKISWYLPKNICSLALSRESLMGSSINVNKYQGGVRKNPYLMCIFVNNLEGKIICIQEQMFTYPPVFALLFFIRLGCNFTWRTTLHNRFVHNKASYVQNAKNKYNFSL